MQYRIFPKTGEKISLFGLGTMRLPRNSDGGVDEAEAIRLIRTAIDGGVNYVDTSYLYHDGASEVVLGKALKDGYREKILLADKIPVWLAKDETDLRTIFDEQLARLGTRLIDMYLVHNITAPIWKKARKVDVLGFLEKKRAEGEIRHIGFSFHDSPSFFKEILDFYPWDFCQIQFNYMDANYQAGVEGLRYAASKGVPVIVMEPLRGGLLTDQVPADVQKLWDQADIQRTPAAWALRWVADFPEVLTILNGVSSMAQLTENLSVLSQTPPNCLTDRERDIIQQAADAYNQLLRHACTKCRYCAPCPNEVDIATILGYYNEWFLYGQNPKTKSLFNMFIPEKRRPGKCDGCKTCEERCPQGIPIAEAMKKAAAIFD